MPLSDWTFSYFRDPTPVRVFTESNVSPIQGSASLLMSYGPDPFGHDLGLVAKTTGAGVSTGLIRTLFNATDTDPAMGVVCMLDTITNPPGDFASGYWLSPNIGGPGTLYLMRGKLSPLAAPSPATLLTLGLPYGTITPGAIYAMGLEWEHDTISDAMVLTVLSSPGVVTGAYDYSTMVVVGTFVDSDPGRITSGVSAGLFVESGNGPGTHIEERFDVTEICV